MELFSSPFIDAFNRLLAQHSPLLATIPAREHQVTDAIKRRPGTELLEVRQDNAGQLRTDLTARLSG